jgi:hypothetical protein
MSRLAKFSQIIIGSTLLIVSGQSTTIANILKGIGPEYGSTSGDAESTLAGVFSEWGIAEKKNTVNCTANLSRQGFLTKALITNFIGTIDLGTKFREIAADEEFATTAFGKIKKIRRLMNCINENQNKFQLISPDKIDIGDLLSYTSAIRAVSILNTADYCAKTTAENKGALGDPFGDESGGYTYFGRLNALLDKIRGVQIKNGPSAGSTGEAGALFALTQVGSRGFDSTLVERIAEIGTGTGADKVTAKDVLKKIECWEVIWGKNSDVANPIGSIRAQLKFVDSKISSTDAYSSITSKITDISERFVSGQVNDLKLADLYGYLVPKTSDGYKRLDRLNQSIIETMCSESNLTIQECLDCLLAGNALTSAQIKNLATQIDNRCDQILGCFTAACCNKLYGAFRVIEDETYRTGQVLSHIALDPVAHAWVWPGALTAIQNVTTSLTTLMNASSLLSVDGDPSLCVGDQLVVPLNTFGAALANMNNALATISGVSAPEGPAKPTDAKDYCSGVCDILKSRIPTNLGKIYDSFENMLTELGKISGYDTSLSLTDFTNLKDVIAAFNGVFTNSITFKEFCKTVHQNASTATCDSLQNLEPINDKMGSIVLKINACETTLAAIIDKLNHINARQSLANTISVIDESIFHLSQALANPQLAVAPAIFTAISGKLQSITSSPLPSANPASLLELATAINALTNALGRSPTTYVPSVIMGDSAACSPCTKIIHALSYSIPQHLHEILKAIGRLNSEISMDLKQFSHSDPEAETRINALKIMLTFLERFMGIIPCDFTINIDENGLISDPNCETWGHNQILTALNEIRSAINLGLHQLNALIKNAEHTLHCAPHDEIHRALLLKIKQVSRYATAITDKPFNLFDRWDEDGENLMAKALAALSYAFDQYPSFEDLLDINVGEEDGPKEEPLATPPVYVSVYNIGIDAFTSFSDALNFAITEFLAPLVGQIPAGNSIEELSTDALWAAIANEFVGFKTVLAQLASAVRQKRDCVIPVLFEAFVNLSASINGAINKLRLSPAICLHGKSMPPIEADFLDEDFSDFALLFKDKCAEDEFDDCRDVAKYLTCIFEFLIGDASGDVDDTLTQILLSKNLPEDINATLQAILAETRKLTHDPSNPTDLAAYFREVAHAIIGADPDISSIHINNRYGTCAELIGMIERILQLVPYLHKKMQQSLVLANPNSLITIENFQDFIAHLDDVMAAFLRKGCITCNDPAEGLQPWRYGSVTQKLTQLSDALKALVGDIKANWFAKNVVIPVAESLSSIHASIATLDESTLNSSEFGPRLGEFFEKLISYDFGGGVVGDWAFFKDAISILAAGGAASPFPVYLGDIHRFTNELCAFISQSFNSIARDIGLLQVQPYDHSRPNTIRGVRHILNALPSLRSTFLAFAESVQSDMLLRCTTGFVEIERYLEGLLEQLMVPPPCVTAINKTLHKWYTAVLDFVNGDSALFPCFLIPKILDDSSSTPDIVDDSSLMALILSEAADIDGDVSTPLQVTLARLLDAFSLVPARIFSLQNATPEPLGVLIPKLKEFQANALTLLRALRDAKFEMLCDYDAYVESISIIKLSNIKQLSENITFAIMDLERSLHVCELMGRLRSIGEKTQMLHAYAFQLLKGDESLDEYVTRLERLLNTVTSGDPYNQYLNGLDAVLDFLNSSFTQQNFGAFPALKEVQDEASDLIISVAECFRTLADPNTWANAHSHMGLSRILRFIGNRLNDFLNLTNFPEPCDVCSLNVNKFLQYYASAIVDIQKSCTEGAKLCEVCEPCKSITVAVFTLAQLTKSVAEYSIEFPNYDRMNNARELLQGLTFSADALSCDNAQGYVDSLCEMLDQACAALFGPNFNRGNIVIPPGDSCKILEVACTQIYDNIANIVDKFAQVLYNAQAPPNGAWESVENFTNVIGTFADNLGTTLKNIVICSNCNSFVFSEMSSLITEKLNELKTLASQLNEQWNVFQDYGDNTKFLVTLFNFYEMHKGIDAYLRAPETQTVDDLLIKLQVWADYAKNFTGISTFSNTDEFLTRIGYYWGDPVFASPTRAFIQDYVKEIAGVSHQILATLNYVRDFLNNNIAQLDEQTLRIISQIKAYPSAWQKFIEVISQLKEATSRNIPIEIPIAFLHTVDQMVQVFDDIASDLANKPSICQERSLQLLAVVNALSELKDATTLNAICENPSEEYSIFSKIIAISNFLTASLTGPKQNCETADVALCKINGLLNKINANLLNIMDVTDFAAVDESVAANFQSTLKAVYDALRSVSLESRPCVLCNKISTTAYEAERLLLVDQIANNLMFIHDQLERAKGAQKKYELSVVSSFCGKLAAYFETWFKEGCDVDKFKGNFDINEFWKLTTYLRQSLNSVETWINGTFADLLSNIETTNGLTFISTHDIVCPPKQALDWYYQHLQDSFATILRTLIVARQSIPYEVAFVSAVRNFSLYASDLGKTLKTALLPDKRLCIAQILNFLDDIAGEGDLWIYIEPVRDYTAMLEAYRQLESLAQNLKKIDEHMSGPWADIADWSILSSDRETSLEQMLSVAQEIVQKVNAPAIGIYDASTHENNAVLATRYNFWLEQVAETLDSIIRKLAQNHTMAIPECVRQQLLRFRIEDIGPVDIDGMYEVTLLKNSSVQTQERIRQQISEIADILLGKCCAPESHFFSELATEFYKLSAFFETLTQNKLVISNVNSIISNIFGIASIPYVEHTISTGFLNAMRSLTALFPSIAEPSTTPFMHNCKRKRIEFEKIRECIRQMGSYVRILGDNLIEPGHGYDNGYDAQELIRALQHLGQVWKESLPNLRSACCGTPEEFFSLPLVELQDELQRVAKLLVKVHYSTELQDKMLVLLQSLEMAHNGVTNQIKPLIASGEASDSAFENLFNKLVAAFTGIEAHTHSFESVFNVSDDLLPLVASGTATTYPLDPRDIFDFVLFKVSEVVKKFSDSFYEILCYWNTTSPTYADATYNHIVQMQKLISAIRANLDSILSQPIDAISNQLQFLKARLYDVLHGKTLTQLASFYAKLKDAEKIEDQLKLASAIQELHRAITSCASTPQVQTMISGVEYNITNTTKLDGFVRAWLNGLARVEHAQAGVDKSAFLASIAQFAKDVIDEHVRLGGTALPSPVPLVRQQNTESQLIATFISDWVNEIQMSVRQLFQVYLAQPYTHSSAIREFGIGTINFCQRLAAFFQEGQHAGSAIDYLLAEDVLFRMAPVFHELADYLQASFDDYESKCCESNSIDGIRIEFEKLVNEVSVLTMTLNATSGAEVSNDLVSNVAASIDVFWSSLNTAATQLAITTPEVLCNNWSSIISQSASDLATLRGNIHSISYSVNASVSAVQDPTSLQGPTAQQNSVALASLIYLLRNAPESLVNSFTKLENYSAKTTQTQYSAGLVDNLKHIASTIQKIQARLETFVVASICAPSELPFALNDMAHIFGDLALKMESVIVNMRLRLWTPYAKQVHKLRISFETQARHVQSLIAAKSSNVLAGETPNALPGETANTTYHLLEEQLDKIIGNLNALTPVQLEMGPQMSDAEIREKLNAFTDFINAFEESMLAEFSAIREIFGINAVPASADDPVNEFSFASINDDLGQILAILTNFSEYAQSLVEIDPGFGDLALKKLLQNIATRLGDQGNLSKILQTIFSAYSLTSGKFYNDEKVPVLDQSSGVTARLSTLSRELNALAERFDIERCKILIQTYANNLAVKMQKLNYALSQIGPDREFNWTLLGSGDNGVIGFLHQVTSSIAQLKECLIAHYDAQTDQSEYCQAGIVDIYVKQICEMIDVLASSLLNPGDVPTFDGLVVPAGDGNTVLESLRNQNITYVNNIAKLFMSLTDFARTSGPRVSRENLSKLADVQQALYGVHDAFPAVSDAILKMCTQRQADASQQFIRTLMASISTIHRNFIELTDVLNQFCYNAELENALIDLSARATAFVRSFDAAIFEYKTPNLVAQIGTLFNKLVPAISTYFSAPPHSQEQIDALKAISGLLPSGDMPPRLVPFNESAKCAYTSQIVENIADLLRVIRNWAEMFPPTEFSQNPQAIRMIDGVLQDFRQFAGFFSATNLGNSLVHDFGTVEKIRWQIQFLFDQIFDVLVTLKQAYVKNDCEVVIRQELYATQQIVAALPAALEIVLRKIEGAAETEILAQTANVLSRLPFYAKQLFTSFGTSELENAWQNAEFLAGGAPFSSIVDVKDGIASINSNLSAYVYDLLGEKGDVQSLFESNDLPVAALLENIKSCLTNLHIAMTRVASAAICLKFDENYILHLTRADGPLALIIDSKGGISSLVSCLCQNPAYSSYEWGLILGSFDEIFEKLRSAFFKIRDAVQIQRDAQELQRYRKIYERMHQLSETLENTLGGSTLTQAAILFRQLGDWLPKMLMDFNNPDAHYERLGELLDIFCVGGSISPADEPINRFSSLSEVHRLIRTEILHLENVIGGLIPLWLHDPYKLNQELISDVSIVLEQVTRFPIELHCVSGHLQNFLSQLQHPTFCNERNFIMGKIEAEVAAISRTLKAVSRNIHFLDDSNAASLTELIPQISEQIFQVSVRLGDLVGYEEPRYKEVLEELLATIAIIKEQITAVADLFGTAASDAHPVNAPTCEDVDVFIARFTNYTCDMQEDFRAIIERIIPLVGEVTPFKPSLIETIRGDLAPALASLLDALSTVGTREPEVMSCGRHNQFAQYELAKEIQRQIAILTAYPQYLSEKLAQFEQSILGRDIRALHEVFKNVETVLSTLANIEKWDAEMLARVDERFISLQALLLQSYKSWTQQLNNENCITELTNSLGLYVDELREFLSILGRPALPQVTLTPTTFGERQISEDIAEIQMISRAIFEVILPQIYQYFVSNPMLSPSLSGVFRALSFFAHPKPELATDAMRQQILTSLWPTLPSTTLHQLEFILKNPTCCREYTEAVARIINLYTASQNDLNQMSGALFNQQISDPLSKAERMIEMLDVLNAFKATATTVRVRTDALIFQMECAASDTCFSDHDTQLLLTLNSLGNEMEAVKTHTAQIYATYRAINDLNPSESASNPSFSDFSSKLEELNVYYDENIAVAWDELNDILEQQQIAIQTVKCILTHTPVCFWRSASFFEQFKTFGNLEQYISYSREALAVYKTRSLAQGSMRLYRIHQQLQPIVMLEKVLLRRVTLSDANTCFGEINVALEQISSLLVNLHENTVYSLNYLNGISKIEACLSKITDSLATYATTHGIPSLSATFDNSRVFKDADFSNYIEQIMDDLEESCLLQRSLKRWVATINSENGANKNERCYTEVFASTAANVKKIGNAFGDIVGNLKETFVSSFIHSTLQTSSTSMLDNAFQRLATGIYGIASIVSQVDSLAKNPTCCYLRLVNVSSLCKELDTINNAIIAVTENLAANIFDSANKYSQATVRIVSAISSLREISDELADIEPNPAYICQGEEIAAQTANVILPAIRSTVSALRDVLALVNPMAEPEAPFAIEDSNVCQELIERNKALKVLAEGITSSLMELRNRIAVVDLFEYSPTFVSSLKNLLYELLHTHERLDSFCQSFESDSCGTCNDVNYGQFLQRFLSSFKIFEEIIHIIENNECKKFSRELHSLTNAADTFAQNVCLLLAVDDACFSDMQKLSDVITSLFVAATDANSIPLGNSLTSMPIFAELLDKASLRVCSALQTLGLHPIQPVYALVSYEQALIDEDNVRLVSAFKMLTTAINCMQADKNHFSALSYWSSLAEATHQLACKFLNSNVNSQVAKELLSIYEAQRKVISKLRQLEYCKAVDVAIEGFSGLICDFVSIFKTGAHLFKRNLLHEYSQEFAIQMSLVTDEINGLISDIASLTPINDDSRHFCSTNYAALDTLQERISLIERATIDLLKVFDSNFQISQSREIEGLSKNITMRRIVENLHLLQQAMSAAWAEARLCPVRDYHEGTIVAAKALLSAFNGVISNLSNVFSLTNICGNCNPGEATLICSEISPILTKISTDLEGVIDYLESMCCSRLDFQIYQFVDKTNIISQYLSALASKNGESLNVWLSNELLNSDAARLTSLLMGQLSGKTFALKDWSNFASLFANSGESHCSARDTEEYFNLWLHFLDETIGVLNAHFPNNFESGVAHPDVYNCAAVPSAVENCVASVLNICASLGTINQKLQSCVISYSQTINLYILIRGFKAALSEFATIGKSQSIAFCSKCNPGIEFTQRLSQDNPFGALELQLDALIENLTRYCNYECIKHWHSFGNNLDYLNAILENLNVSDFWNNRNSETVNKGMTTIGSLYVLANSSPINDPLKLILISGTGDDQICQMAYLLPHLALFDEKFEQLVSAMVIIFGEPRISKDTSQPAPDNFSFAAELSKIVDALTSSRTALSNIQQRISKNGLTGNKNMSSFFTNIGTGLAEQSEIFKQIYGHWQTKFPCPKLQYCTVCKNCTNCRIDPPSLECTCQNESSIQYQIWQISTELVKISEIMMTTSQIISPDCCTDAFEHLFGVPTHLRTIQYDIGDGLTWESIFEQDNFVNFIRVLSNLDPIFDNLNALIATRETLRRENDNSYCQMSHFIEVFQALKEAFDQHAKATSNFLEAQSISTGTRQQVGSSKPSCKEISMVLPSISNEFSLIAKQFLAFSEKVSKQDVILRDSIAPLMALYDQLIRACEIVETLIVPDTQRQICYNCDKAIINAGLGEIRNSIQKWAEAVLAVKNAFLEKFCCEDFGLRLAETDYIVRTIRELTSRFPERSFQPQDIYINLYSVELARIAEAVRAANQKIARMLSIRESLPAANPVDFCSLRLMVPTLNELNGALISGILSSVQDFLARLGLEIALPDPPVFERKICTSLKESIGHISTSMEGIFQDLSLVLLRVKEIQLTQSPTLVEKGEDAIKALSDALSQTLDLLHDFALSTQHKKVCDNCDCYFEVKSMQEAYSFIPGVFAELHVYLHSKQHLSIRSALSEFLNSYGIFMSMFDHLHLASSIDSRMNDVSSPYFGEFKELLLSWSRGFEKLVNIFPQITALQQEKGCVYGMRNEAQFAFIQRLSDIRSELDEMAARTHRFLTSAVGNPVSCPLIPVLDINSCEYVQEFMAAFNHYSADAAEALQWFEEQCAFYNVKARDANTLAAIVEFTQTISAWKTVEEIVPQCVVSSFSESVKRVRDVLIPEKIDVASELNQMTALFEMAAQNIHFPDGYDKLARFTAISDSVEEYVSDINQLFGTFSVFAQWSQQLKESQNLAETIHASPTVALQQITLRIRQRFGVEGLVAPIPNSRNIKQAFTALGISVHTFVKELFYFVNNVANVHQQHRIEIDLRLVANAKTAAFIVQNALTNLNVAEKSEFRGLIRSIEVSRETLANIAASMTQIQETVRYVRRQDRLDALSCDLNGVPVVKRLLVPLYDEHGMPMLTSDTSSVVSATGALMDDATNVQKRVLGTVTVNNFLIQWTV